LFCGLTWFTLENIPSEIEKNMYSAFVGWSVSWKSARSRLFIMLVKSPMSLLVFSQVVLFIDSRVLKSPTVIGELHFPLQFYQYLLHVFWGPVVRCMYVHSYNIFLMDWYFYHYLICFVFHNNFCLKVFFLILVQSLWLTLISFAYLFPSFYFQPLCVFF
jgi:hypothetical protein